MSLIPIFSGSSGDWTLRDEDSEFGRDYAGVPESSVERSRPHDHQEPRLRWNQPRTFPAITSGLSGLRQPLAEADGDGSGEPLPQVLLQVNGDLEELDPPPSPPLPRDLGPPGTPLVRNADTLLRGVGSGRPSASLARDRASRGPDSRRPGGGKDQATRWAYLVSGWWTICGAFSPSHTMRRRIQPRTSASSCSRSRAAEGRKLTR
jgi:hypothetical protein